MTRPLPQAGHLAGNTLPLTTEQQSRQSPEVNVVATASRPATISGSDFVGSLLVQMDAEDRPIVLDVLGSDIVTRIGELHELGLTLRFHADQIAVLVGAFPVAMLLDRH